MRGTEPRAHGCPSERPGTTTRGVSPGPRGAVSWIPQEAGLHAGAPALGTFPAQAGALSAPCHRLRGTSAATRGGGAPVPGPRLGAGAVWCWLWLLLPGIAPPGRRRPKSPEPAKEPPARPKSRPRRPQPTTCHCAPYPGLISGAQDPGERPHPSPTLGSCAPGTRLSRLPPLPNYLLPPALSQSSTHTPSQTLRGWDRLLTAILIPRPVELQNAGKQAAPRRNSPALPSPAPGGSRPWLGPSVTEPQLPVRRQKPDPHDREPPPRPSAPPPRRGLSSWEGSGRALPCLADEAAPGRVLASLGAPHPFTTLPFEQLEIEGG